MNLQMLWVIAPDLLVCLSAIVLLMIGAFLKERALTTVLLGAAAALVVAAVMVLNQPSDVTLIFADMIRLDGFILFSKLLILIGALMALVFASDWLQQPGRRVFEYPVLVLLATFGLLLMVGANDFLSLYMALELASLSLYVLAAFDREDGYSTEAGLKYFVLGALASGMLLFGVSLVYGFSGTTNFALLANLVTGEGYQLTAGLALGMVLVIVGLCFKVSAVPFHMWTPDVYQGAPTPVVAFFAVAPKVAALILLSRLMLQPFGALADYWVPIVTAVSIASMVIGAFGALRQQDIKRLLAYSSIGHVGYALIAIVVGGADGMQAMLVYLALYLFMSLGAFGFVMLMQREGQPVTRISELAGLSKTCPRAALFMAIMMFSMAGIPPLAGFFGKFYIFKAAIDAQLYGLVVIGLLSSVVAAFYYIKIVKIMYFDPEKAPFDTPKSLQSRAVLAICALVTCFFFLSPTSLLEMTAHAVILFRM